MTNNKQQTAVEWYIEKLLDLDYEYAKGLINLGVWSERKKSLIEQAKAMHKEEIIEAFDQGVIAEVTHQVSGAPETSGQEYFNQTYGDGLQ